MEKQEKKIAIYPGSFNPWHEGHSDILRKALKVFDVVIISAGRNPEKTACDYNLHKIADDFKDEYCCPHDKARIVMWHFTGLLVDHIKEIGSKIHIDAVIRGFKKRTRSSIRNEPTILERRFRLRCSSCLFYMR